MNRVIDLRLKKLEAYRKATAYSDLTYDELQVAIYECAQRIIQDPTAEADDMKSATATASDIRDDIVATARRLLDPDYQHWLQRDFGSSHVAAVTCGTWHGSGETNDLSKPRIMERRNALRNSAIVQSILKEAGRAAIN
jgi:hypothetical protein